MQIEKNRNIKTLIILTGLNCELSPLNSFLNLLRLDEVIILFADYTMVAR